MAFLTTVFFVLFGLYIFGLVVKVLFRVWIVRKARQFQQGGGGNFRTYTWGTGGANGGQESRPRRKPEGAVTVEQAAPRQKRVSKSVGDYVEFEEVEDADR